MPRDFYARNPRGFEKPVTFIPGYQLDRGIKYESMVGLVSKIAQLAEWDTQTMALELETCLRGSAVSVLNVLPHCNRTYYHTLVH